MKIVQPLYSDEQRGSLWRLIYFSMRGGQARASRFPQRWTRRPGATAPNASIMKNALQRWRAAAATHAEPWYSYAPFLLTRAPARSATSYETRRATISSPAPGDTRRLHTLNN